MTTLNCKSLFIFVLFSVFGSLSLAQTKIGPSVGAMVLFGTGKTGNSTDVLDRSMVHTTVALFGGFNLKKLRLGLNYEYDLVGQSDDPSALGNQNIGGKGTAPGLRLDFYDGKNSFGAIYRVSEKYVLDKPTLAGTVADYDGKSGFSIQYYRQLKKKLGLVFDYSSGEMKSSAANSNDIKWSRISLGLVFTNFLSSK